jgi:hypothetical protein
MMRPLGHRSEAACMSESSIDVGLKPVPRVSTIRVDPARGGGWDLRIESNGQVITTEHFSDWHRVERRRACLRLRLAQQPSKEAA